MNSLISFELTDADCAALIPKESLLVNIGLWSDLTALYFDISQRFMIMTRLQNQRNRQWVKIHAPISIHNISHKYATPSLTEGLDPDVIGPNIDTCNHMLGPNVQTGELQVNIFGANQSITSAPNFLYSIYQLAASKSVKHSILTALYLRSHMGRLARAGHQMMAEISGSYFRLRVYGNITITIIISMS